MDVSSLTSSRSGTKFAAMKLSLIKCQRASMVCFRISSYAQTYIHFIRKTKLLIHTSTLAMLRQELFCKKQGRSIRNRLLLPFCLPSNNSLIRLLCFNSKAKQPFRFGASSPYLPALLQFSMPPHIARRQKPRGICHGALSTV